MVYLLDTNVVSEAIKQRPEARVMAWLAAQPSATLYLSVLTIGEIEQGLTRSPSPRRAERLAKWLEEDLAPRFRGRLLSVDADVMKTWGRITGRALLQGRPVSYVDSLLAATAIAHGLSLATRNVGDASALPVQTTNRWDGPGTSAPVKGN
jgi:predicted nucleic acid-binding protein